LFSQLAISFAYKLLKGKGGRRKIFYKWEGEGRERPLTINIIFNYYENMSNKLGAKGRAL